MKIRGLEEIQGSLQAFRDVYEAQFGKKLSDSSIRTMAYMLLDEKERELLRQRLFDFHPQDLKTLIEICQDYVEKPVEAVDNSKNIQRKPKGKLK